MKKQLLIDDELVEVDVIEMNTSFVLFSLEGIEYKVNLGALQDGKMVLNLNGKNRPVVLYDTQYVVDGREFSISAPRRQRTKLKSTGYQSNEISYAGKNFKNSCD